MHIYVDCMNAHACQSLLGVFVILLVAPTGSFGDSQFAIAALVKDNCLTFAYTTIANLLIKVESGGDHLIGINL